MKLRSLLFVPGDRPERFAKAATSGADAIIIDLEDSVALDQKSVAHAAVVEYLAGDRGGVPTFVRVNPVESDLCQADVDAIIPVLPDGIVLPKTEGARSIRHLRSMIDGEMPPVLPIAAESPGGVLDLGTLREVAGDLVGISWGAEDLPAAMGAATSREADGSYTPPYEMVRSFTLIAAHAAGVLAIDTVFPGFKDVDALAAYARRAARDGFTGMLAIHPAQVTVINEAFTPSPEQIAHAQAVIAAFAANPGKGALQLDGKMIDAPHLKAAHAILARV